MDELWNQIPKAFHATVKNSAPLKWITDVLRDFDRRLKDVEAAALHFKMERARRASPEVAAVMKPTTTANEGPVAPAGVDAAMSAEDAWENM